MCQNLRLQSFGQIVYIFRSSITYFKKSNYLIRPVEISFEWSNSVFLINIPRFAIHFSSNLLHASTNYVLMNTDIINLLSSCIFKWTILYRFIDVHRSIRSCNTMALRTEWTLQYALSSIRNKKVFIFVACHWIHVLDKLNAL